MARLIGYGADDAFDSEAALVVDGLDRHAPELAGGATLTIGNVLCDLGEHARARQWAARARQAPMPLPSDARDNDALWGRLMIVDGSVDDGRTRALEAVEDARASGLGRAAEVMLARVAQTLRTVGRDDLASPLREEAARNLPGTRTIWEQVLLGPEPTVDGDGEGRAARPDTVVRLRALAPDLVVEVDGEVHPLGRLPARIIGLLVAAGRPLTIDQVVDAIWPDVELDAAKHRLAMALHRLRSALPAAAAAIVVRDQHGLRLADAGRRLPLRRRRPARRRSRRPRGRHGRRPGVRERLRRAPAGLRGLGAGHPGVVPGPLRPDGRSDPRRPPRPRASPASVDSAEALTVAAHVRHLAVTDGALAERVVRTYTVAGRPGEATALVADAARAAVLTDPELAALTRLAQGS